jgi:hypothetical protein
VAPGKTAPLASVTAPLILPGDCCALTEIGLATLMMIVTQTSEQTNVLICRYLNLSL